MSARLYVYAIWEYFQSLNGLVTAVVLVALLSAIVMLDIMGMFSSNKFPVDGQVRLSFPVSIPSCYSCFIQTAVITGGSQGMGRALGRLLAQKGANVVIVARDQEKLARAIEYISVRPTLAPGNHTSNPV